MIGINVSSNTQASAQIHLHTGCDIQKRTSKYLRYLQFYEKILRNYTALFNSYLKRFLVLLYKQAMPCGFHTAVAKTQYQVHLLLEMIILGIGGEHCQVTKRSRNGLNGFNGLNGLIKMLYRSVPMSVLPVLPTAECCDFVKNDLSVRRE